MRKIDYPKRGSKEFDDLKDAYKKIYSTAELTQMQTNWDDWKVRNHVTTIPETVETLMLADVDILADVYERFASLPIRRKMPGPRGRDVRSTEMKELDAIFKYTQHYDDRIAKFFCDHADEFHISSCHYCELAYVNTYRVITGGAATYYQHFDVDHFLPKTHCPIIGLSLFNFVPSCQVCNSRIKSSRTVGKTKSEWIKFSPVNASYDFDKYVTVRLRMHRGPDTSFRKKGEYYIYFRCKNGFRTEVDFFHLEERYEFHKMEAMRLKRLKAQYPLSARRKIAGMLGKTEAEVREDLFHKKFLKDNHRCFAKLTEDMLK